MSNRRRVKPSQPLTPRRATEVHHLGKRGWVAVTTAVVALAALVAGLVATAGSSFQEEAATVSALPSEADNVSSAAYLASARASWTEVWDSSTKEENDPFCATLYSNPDALVSQIGFPPNAPDSVTLADWNQALKDFFDYQCGMRDAETTEFYIGPTPAG